MKKIKFGIVLTVLLLSIAERTFAHDSLTFVVSAPDAVELGKPMTVVYKLHSNEYRNIVYPKYTNFELHRYSSAPFDSYFNHSRYQEFEWIIVLTPYKTGSVAIPPMTVTVGGQQITSSPKSVIVTGKSSPLQDRQLKALNQFWASSQMVYSPKYHAKPSFTRHPVEMEISQKFLMEKGQHPDNIWLNEVFSNDDLVMFSDDWNSCFVITATKKYARKLDNLVLAYSTESSLQKHQELVDFYTDALKNLLVSGQDTPSMIHFQNYTKKSCVKPLLGNLRWGTGIPYNIELPMRKDGGNQKSGPAAVAMAQLMAFYKYPQQLREHHFYRISPTTELGMDFSATSLNWDQFKDHYSKAETNTVASHLIAACAFAVETEWPKPEYTRCTGMRNFKAALTNYFGYSNKSAFVEHASGNLIISLLYKDLESGRPVIAQGMSTYFVCDGYDENFFHFNIGAEQYLNGYYRILLLGNSETSEALVNSMIIGIEPDTRKEISKEVIIDKPGMLEGLLSGIEKENVTHLTVKGKLNGEDIKVIRHMAGVAGYEYGMFSRPGMLTHLDLSEASFVTDKEHPYVRKDGSGYTYTQITYYGGSSYGLTKSLKMKEATEDEMKKARRSGVLKGKGYKFGGGVDSELYVDFTMKKGIVTPFMFEGCDNLQTIILPEDIKEIEDGAFDFCNSLVNITLPSKVKSVYEGSFMNCYNLERVYYKGAFCPQEKEGIHCRLAYDSGDIVRGLLKGAFAGNNPSTCKGFKKYSAGE